jgi:LAO/AO transport system kinase
MATEKRRKSRYTKGNFRLSAEISALSLELERGERRALSKLISILDEDKSSALTLLERLYKDGKRSYRIGITGPPGAGKSTLVDRLVFYIRKELKKRVGVIAIDPSSPFTGGALLGDRIRMQTHFNDDGVFIRSLSNRGERGGISFSARLLAGLYDAYGFNFTIIETVGVGQSETDIMDLADTTIVVLVPESGDTIQTMKAGILEVADIFVVNKSDRQGSEEIAEELRQMVHMKNGQPQGWVAPVVLTQASKDVGITTLFNEIQNHMAKGRDDSNIRRKLSKNREIVEVALADLKVKLDRAINHNKKFKGVSTVEGVNPYSVAKILIKTIR